MKEHERRRSKLNGGLIGGDSWASYSDLIAGVLLIFILVTVLKDAEIQRMVAEPAEVLQGWEHALSELCNDEDLKAQNLAPDCNTGTIELPDQVFFGFSDTELRESGKEHLRQAMPIILDKLRGQKAIWERLNVEVRGHADPTVNSDLDPYSVNLGYSARRAESVLQFLASDPAFNEQDQRDIKEKAVASGASHSLVPVGCEGVSTEECYSKRRRVEIHLRLDDEQIRQALIELLKQLQSEFVDTNADTTLG